MKQLTFLLTYWLFHLLLPLMMGRSAIYCVTDLMAFFHSDMSLAKLIFSCFLHRSSLTTSLNLNVGLPWDIGLPTLKLRPNSLSEHP